METQKSHIQRIVIFILLLTVSCRNTPGIKSIPTATKPQAATITARQPSSTITTSLQATTPIPSSTTESRAPSPTTSPTVTQELPTATLPPALPAAEAVRSILDLLKTNGSCKLPCWWGLTPGKTSAQDIKSFLARFRNIPHYFSVFDEKGGAVYIEVPSNDLIVRPVLEYRLNNKDDTVEMLSVSLDIVRKVNEGGYVVNYGDPLNAQLLRIYTLPQVLSTYGKPMNVLVYGNRGMWQFNIMLAYPQAGILVNYIAPLKDVGVIYSECPSQAYPTFWLWPAEHKYTPAEVVSIQLGEGIGQEWLANFLPIEESTSLTVEEFYNIFKDDQNTACIETPINLWPVP